MWSQLFQRLANIFKAKAHNAVDHLENPVEMSKLAIAELEKAISDATEAFSMAIANHKKWDRELQQASLASENWKQKAKLAIGQSNEEMAKRALTEKSNEDRKAMEYTAIFQKSEKDLKMLRQNLDSLQMKLKEMKSKQSVLEAKAKNAEAQGKIAKQLTGIGTSALSNFQRYEEKINEMADQNEALQESLLSQKQLEREFDQLENSVNVNTELEELKTEMQTEEQKKKEQEEAKKLEKVKIKIDSQTVQMNPVKQIAPPREAKLKQFFNEK
ncbi:MAG TPA: PspA/IM30 family protein [Cyclobacteriaceae bacterium]|nr:PspA/IM30 family protein [Cyclobacteriaceae bacterium]